MITYSNTGTNLTPTGGGNPIQVNIFFLLQVFTSARREEGWDLCPGGPMFISKPEPFDGEEMITENIGQFDTLASLCV